MSLIGVCSFKGIDGFVKLLEVRVAQPRVVPELPVVAALTSSRRRLLLALGLLLRLAPAWKLQGRPTTGRFPHRRAQLRA